jgi:hypothetical protein
MAELAPTRPRRFRVLWLLAAAVALFAGANAHLVYVAVSSEPGCVTHLKDKSGSPGEYRAAKSAC